MLVGLVVQASLVKMLAMWVSTVLTSITPAGRRSPRLDRPSAISASTSRSRSVRSSSGLPARRRAEQAARRPPGRAPCRRRRRVSQRVGEGVDVDDPVLEQVAEAAGVPSRAASARSALSTYWESSRMPSSGLGSRGARRRPRAPSSVNVGGIRMSTIATSGSCSRDRPQRAPSASPRRADDLDARLGEQPGQPLAQQRPSRRRSRRARQHRLDRRCRAAAAR